MLEIVVCQECDKVLHYVESEKVGVIYATCLKKHDCDHHEKSISDPITHYNTN